MKLASSTVHALTSPQYIEQATYLNQQLRRMNKTQLMTLMGVSGKIADTVKAHIDNWMDETAASAAALTFRGDIYSGLSAATWNKADAQFAQKHLVIVSGLYGLLRPYDQIKPYRLEMGYKFKLDNGMILDKFWENEIAQTLDTSDVYLNLTSKEYFKVVEKRLQRSRMLTPKFLTVNDKTSLPVFVTVHAKIARGSFANWLITNKIDDAKQIVKYDQLNYRYHKRLSTDTQPVFVCQQFGGLGLSIRLK
jgi:hypothetical protein